MQLPDVPEEQAIATVHRAMELGINHYETARGYGASEEILGRALRSFDRASFILTTKITPKHYQNYQQCIEESLTRLQVDYLDNFDIHGINNEEQVEWVFKKGGALEAVHQAMSEGLIRHVGFSSHGQLEIILRVIETQAFESVNLHYYYFNQRNLPALRRAGELDMGGLIISPTDKGGQLHRPSQSLRELTAPYHPITINHRFLFSHPEVTTVTVGAAHPDEFAPHLRALETGGPLTEETLMSRWLTKDHENVIPAEAGIQNAGKGLDSHFRGNDGQLGVLSSEEQEIIARLDSQYKKLGNTFCTLCHKCLPCPERINIPEVLRLRNLAIAFDMVDFGRYRYKMFENADHWFGGRKAIYCTKCNDCLPRCPEKLDIPALLMEAHEMLYREEGKRKWSD